MPAAVCAPPPPPHPLPSGTFPGIILDTHTQLPTTQTFLMYRYTAASLAVFPAFTLFTLSFSGVFFFFFPTMQNRWQWIRLQSCHCCSHAVNLLMEAPADCCSSAVSLNLSPVLPFCLQTSVEGGWRATEASRESFCLQQVGWCRNKNTGDLSLGCLFVKLCCNKMSYTVHLKQYKMAP